MQDPPKEFVITTSKTYLLGSQTDSLDGKTQWPFLARYLIRMMPEQEGKYTVVFEQQNDVLPHHLRFYLQPMEKAKQNICYKVCLPVKIVTTARPHPDPGSFKLDCPPCELNKRQTDGLKTDDDTTIKTFGSLDGLTGEQLEYVILYLRFLQEWRQGYTATLSSSWMNGLTEGVSFDLYAPGTTDFSRHGAKYSVFIPLQVVTTAGINT